METRYLERSFGLVVLFPLSLFLLTSQLHTEESGQANVSSGWRKAKEAFDTLIREPSSITTREFYLSIPDDKEISGDRAGVLDHIFQYEGYRYGTINIEMLHGDIYAARSAIRLMKFVEADRQEMVGKSLGELIRVNPAVFLRTCHAERKDPYVKKKGFPVGFIPPIMKKKERAAYELGNRREALRSVEDPELRPVRDECIKGIEKTIEELGLEVPSCADQEERRWDDPREHIKSVLKDIQRIPCPENMKRLLALFSDDRDFNIYSIVLLLFPNPESVGHFGEYPIDVILYEARCGNEYAIEVLLRTCSYVWGFPTIQISIRISNLILINPKLFIEKLAKYRHDLKSAKIVDFIDWMCRYISWTDYPEEELDEDVILRRRIDALASLNIPEHKELIDHCISSIKRKLKRSRHKKSISG